MDAMSWDFYQFPDAAESKTSIECAIESIRSATISDLEAGRFAPVEVPALSNFDHPLGALAKASWREFVMGVFLADWACFSRPADRVDFTRLLTAIAIFPQGFRLWVCRLSDGRSIPAGYSGWYPIAKTTFDRLCYEPESISHRGEMVGLNNGSPKGQYIYLFNISIIRQLHRSAQSRALLTRLRNDLNAAKALGIATVAVSEAGERVARRFGLEYTGDMVFCGEREKVFAARFGQGK
jgi:hypothetical protein